MTSHVSIEQLMTMLPPESADRLFRYQAIQNETDFVSYLYKEIHTWLRELESIKSHCHNDGEEALTNRLVGNLKNASYLSATSEPDHNGHVDLLVEYFLRVESRRITWIGEAKLHDSSAYLKLDEGLQQLMNRYSTSKEINMGFVIYIRNQNAKNVMDRWMAYVNKNKTCNLKNPVSGYCSGHYMDFDSIHVHVSSKIDVEIRHFHTVLHYKPTV
jgi:hypothetical protein